MGTTVGAVVWEGVDDLRSFLVSIADLEPFPGNPRRGDAKAVAGSLRRFGQKKPIVVDGSRIVAGHQVVEGARDELGWTHVAALQGSFPDEDEQRAFLLADNRTSDFGGYDTQLLVDHLQTLADLDALDGTGYTTDDLDQHLATLRRAQAAADAAASPAPDPPSVDPAPATDLRELVLVHAAKQRRELDGWLKIVARERGTDGPSETVYEAARVAAEHLKKP